MYDSGPIYKRLRVIRWAVSGRAKNLPLLRHENLYPVRSAVSNSD